MNIKLIAKAKKWILKTLASKARKVFRKKRLIKRSEFAPMFFLDVNERLLRQPSFKEIIRRRYKVILFNKGLKEFLFDDKVIIALNYRNALRKSKML